MATDRVICPHCGAENVSSPIITMCSSCMGSLKGAKPAPEAAPEPTEAEEPRPPAEPTDFEPARSPEVVPSAAPPEPAELQPPRAADVATPAPRPLDTEPSPLAEPEDFRPPRAEIPVPPLEIPIIVPRPPEAAPHEEPTEAGAPERDQPFGLPLKLICPNCRAANPPHYTHCSLCRTPLPTTTGARVVRGMAAAMRSDRVRDLRRGETAGQTKWGAACGCIVMAFIFFVMIALSALSRL